FHDIIVSRAKVSLAEPVPKNGEGILSVLRESHVVRNVRTVKAKLLQGVAAINDQTFHCVADWNIVFAPGHKLVSDSRHVRHGSQSDCVMPRVNLPPELNRLLLRSFQENGLGPFSRFFSDRRIERPCSESDL